MVLILAGLAGSAAVSGASQWTDLTPPGGALAVAIDPGAPGTLYVGNSAGVFKSTDRGATWRPLGQEIGGPVTEIGIDPLTPSTLYAAIPGSRSFSARGAAIYRSTDAGESWTQVFSNANSEHTSHRLLSLAVTSAAVIAGIEDRTCYFIDVCPVAGRTITSRDGGSTWPGSGYQMATSFAWDLSASTLYSGAIAWQSLGSAGSSRGGVFKSVSSGRSWSYAGSGLPESVDGYTVAVDPTDPSVAYAGAVDLGLFKTTDGGGTWAAWGAGLPTNKTITALTVDHRNPSVVFAGTDLGAYRSGDGGATWSPMGLAGRVTRFVLDPAGGETLYAIWFGRLQQTSLAPEPCAADSTSLCLNAGRFRASVAWRTREGRTGEGQAVPMTSDSGYFWFFNDANVELVVKVVDGRPVNGHFWIFYGALSDVAYTVTVTDTRTGAERTYENAQGNLASVADTGAF